MHPASHSIDVITPLKAFWRWLVATPGQSQPLDHTFDLPVVTHQPGIQTPYDLTLQHQPHAESQAQVHRPLRMIRVMEAGQTSSQVGRMVISGRMADVCAELDRLAAFETQLH